ncbi:hypothetical protein MTR67_051784 [Solanum verrucosum]|uniref:Tf2-1-like SH3-like domain-containing protein n=1 Tax=Solanum verrucosum TaxID=315347 RepID=A0AAF1A316_SOLVR|nr:hypothetical protein MTR67_051784 [Solanum verrucosum]
MSVLYHPDKLNMVADALRQLSRGSVAHVEEDKKELVSYLVEDYAKLYMREMVRLNRVPLSTISIMVPNLHLNFGSLSRKVLVPRVKLSTTFHPQTDGYHSNIGMDPFMALYDKGGKWLKDIKFDVDDWFYLKTSPMKGVMRFGKKEKLSLHYEGSYNILRHFGKVANELNLSSDIASLHQGFHVSLFKKCIDDPTSIVPLDNLGIKECVSYKEVLVEIFDRKVKKLTDNKGTSVKVL